jgi:hypothetical protein
MTQLRATCESHVRSFHDPLVGVGLMSVTGAARTLPKVVANDKQIAGNDVVTDHLPETESDVRVPRPEGLDRCYG